MEWFPSLLPLALLTAYFVVGLAIFALRTQRQGLQEDPEVQGRPASRLLGRYLRHYMMWILSPVERLMVRLRVRPNALTLASLGAALAAGAFLSQGCFAAGGWLYLLTGMLDILDGRVARATHCESPGGAFFDSVIDRYAELAVFSGLAIYYRDSWVLLAVLVAAAGSLMVSYTRARGEALGADVKVGAMQRPERLVYLGVLVTESPVYEAIFGRGQDHPAYPPAIAALLLLAVSSNVTAIRRIFHTLRALDGGPPTATSTWTGGFLAPGRSRLHSTAHDRAPSDRLWSGPGPRRVPPD